MSQSCQNNQTWVSIDAANSTTNSQEIQGMGESVKEIHRGVISPMQMEENAKGWVTGFFKIMSPWQCHGWSIIHSGLSENECLERFSLGALLAITPHALPRTPVCHPPVPLEDTHRCQLLLEMPFPLPCSFLSTDSGHLEKCVNSSLHMSPHLYAWAYRSLFYTILYIILLLEINLTSK